MFVNVFGRRVSSMANICRRLDSWGDIMERKARRKRRLMKKNKMKKQKQGKHSKTNRDFL